MTTAINNIRALIATALLTITVGFVATACGSQTKAPKDALDVTGQVQDKRIYPPTDVPVVEVPARIYPPTNVPVQEYPPGRPGQ